MPERRGAGEHYVRVCLQGHERNLGVGSLIDGQVEKCETPLLDIHHLKDRGLDMKSFIAIPELQAKRD